VVAGPSVQRPHTLGDVLWDSLLHQVDDLVRPMHDVARCQHQGARCVSPASSQVHLRLPRILLLLLLWPFAVLRPVAIYATVVAPPLPSRRALGGQLDRTRGTAVRAHHRLPLGRVVAAAATASTWLGLGLETVLVLLQLVFFSEKEPTHLVDGMIDVLIESVFRRP
jgi:hypothetical protein